jgi:magnesium chelatase family protein
VLLYLESMPILLKSKSQLPAFAAVGLSDSAVRESRERVNAAIKNSNLPFPQKRITIKLAPADIKKEGSAFDLLLPLASWQHLVLFHRMGLKIMSF